VELTKFAYANTTVKIVWLPSGSFNVYANRQVSFGARQQREFYNSIAYGAHINFQVPFVDQNAINHKIDGDEQVTRRYFKKRFHDFEFGLTCFLQNAEKGSRCT
jgi:hypothetical protein